MATKEFTVCDGCGKEELQQFDPQFRVDCQCAPETYIDAEGRVTEEHVAHMEAISTKRDDWLASRIKWIRVQAIPNNMVPLPGHAHLLYCSIPCLREHIAHNFAEQAEQSAPYSGNVFGLGAIVPSHAPHGTHPARRR